VEVDVATTTLEAVAPGALVASSAFEEIKDVSDDDT